MNPRTLLQKHLLCPLSNTTYRITAQRASASVGGKTQVPKAPQGTPREVPGRSTPQNNLNKCDTPGLYP